MERVFTWTGGAGDWSNPANWLYAEYDGPGLYDGGYSTRLANGGPATRAPGAEDTVAFGFNGGMLTGGGLAARLVTAPDAGVIVFADRPGDFWTDAYRFGSINLSDRQVSVSGATLSSLATEIDVTSRLFLSSAGLATDRWGRVYSADLGALTLETEFRPTGTHSGSVIAGARPVEIDSLTGNALVRTDAFSPGGQQPTGGLYSDTGRGYMLDPRAAPGFWAGSLPLSRSGDAWTVDLRVAQGDPGKTFGLGAANIGTGDTLSWQVVDLRHDASWSVHPLSAPRAPLFAGQTGNDLAVTFNAAAPGVHTLTAVLRSFEDETWTGQLATFADQTLTVRLTVDPAATATVRPLSSGGAASEGTANVRGGGEIAFEVVLDAPSVSAQTVQWRVGLRGGDTATRSTSSAI